MNKPYESYQDHVKLPRDFVNWEWYDCVNTFTVFTHCLIMANPKQVKWRGLIIEQGQFVTTFDKLSEETGLSRQNLRTAFRNLESTFEIKRLSTNHRTLITVLKYDLYKVSND